MPDGNPLDKLTDEVSGFAERLGDHVTRSDGSNLREEERYLLPSDLKAALDSPLNDLGFPIEPKVGKLKDWSDKWHNFHYSRVKGGYLAFLYVGNKLLESNIHGNDFVWIGDLFSQHGARGMFIFSDSASIQPSYETMADTWQERQGFLRARFFNHNYISTLITDDFESKKNHLVNWFKLSVYKPAAQIPNATRPFEDLKNDQDRINKIISIIANAAANAIGLTPKDYFNDLVNRTNWSNSWKTQLSGIWVGNPVSTANKLVTWALAKKINMADQNYTTIGGMLEQLIRTDVDREDGIYLWKLIQEYELITDKNIVQKIYDDSFGNS